MKKQNSIRLWQCVIGVLLAVTILAGVIVTPYAQTGEFQASSIEKLDGLKVDYAPYLDSSVMYRLSDNIRADEEISVIITLDQINLMDAYEGTDKTMSFADYALHSDDANALREKIRASKDKLLEKLDEQDLHREISAALFERDYSLIEEQISTYKKERGR
jgi:hypothetical protein